MGDLHAKSRKCSSGWKDKLMWQVERKCSSILHINVANFRAQDVGKRLSRVGCLGKLEDSTDMGQL